MLIDEMYYDRCVCLCLNVRRLTVTIGADAVIPNACWLEETGAARSESTRDTSRDRIMRTIGPFTRTKTLETFSDAIAPTPRPQISPRSAHLASFHKSQSNLTRPTNGKLHQMIHKRLQTNIIRENRLRALTHTTIPTRTTRMRRRWIELGEQETGLRSASVADNETGKRETVLDEVL